MAYGRNFSEYFSSSSDFLFALGTNWFFVYEHMLLLIESLTTTRLGFWLYIHFLHEICTRARTHFSPENDQSSGQNWIFLRIFCILLLCNLTTRTNERICWAKTSRIAVSSLVSHKINTYNVANSTLKVDRTLTNKTVFVFDLYRQVCVCVFLFLISL